MDVPALLAARARLLDTGLARKTDPLTELGSRAVINDGDNGLRRRHR